MGLRNLLKKLIRSFNSEFMHYYKHWEPSFIRYDSFETFCKLYDKDKYRLVSIRNLDDFHKRCLYIETEKWGVCTGIGLFFDKLEDEPKHYLNKDAEEKRALELRQKVIEKYGNDTDPKLGMTMEEAAILKYRNNSYDKITSQTITDANGTWNIWHYHFYSQEREFIGTELQFLNGILIRIHNSY
ncbi:hypothetical protein [Paenibacillus sp. LPE1-1-1.1]|uniref:hypothetical protein n=1 Tax=Paenibacillus sp. LPE1-1-1.1 TaxID=3135230 RepID=UPI00342474ED